MEQSKFFMWCWLCFIFGMLSVAVVVTIIMRQADLPGRWHDKENKIVEYHKKYYKLVEMELTESKE